MPQAGRWPLHGRYTADVADVHKVRPKFGVGTRGRSRRTTVPTLTVGQPRIGSVRGDAHHTMASSMSTSSYGIWCMHRLFTFAFECRGVAAAYHYVSEDGLLVPIITLSV